MEIKSINTTGTELSASQPTSYLNRTKVAAETEKLPKKVTSQIVKPQTSMGFLFNENLSGHAITVIKNKKTGETLRIIPTEEQLKIKKQMAESTGQLLDQIT